MEADSSLRPCACRGWTALDSCSAALPCPHRLRWAQGALQILVAANPLTQPGLTPLQRLMFADSCAYPLSAPALLLICVVPLLWIFSEGVASPVRIHSPTLSMWDLLALLLVVFALREVSLPGQPCCAALLPSCCSCCCRRC